ncbi:hypothetical protein ABE895_11340, partial [Enterococcus avium]
AVPSSSYEFGTAFVYSLKESEYLFVFPVWGMRASFFEAEKDLIFDFEIYDPLRKNIFSDNDRFDETFKLTKNRECTENVKNDFKSQSRCNIVIEIQAVSKNVAKKNALDKYQFFLNLINLKFGGHYNEFFWDGQYIGKEVGKDYGGFGTWSGGKRDERVFRRDLSKEKPVHLSNQKYKELGKYSQVINSLESRGMFIEVNTIRSVVEIMSKSIWDIEENKLLNYWICLESLANISKTDKESKFSFIKDNLSNIYFLWERFDPIHKLFRLTDLYTRDYFQSDNTVVIPQEFLGDIGIYDARSEDSYVSLIQFYKRIEELKSYVSKEHFLDEIEYVQDFYKDNKRALKVMRDKRNKVQLTIDYIYKSRNQIVHNGYVARNLIPFLVKFAEGYAMSLFGRIIEVYLDGEYDLPAYFIKEQYEGILLEKKLLGPNHFDIGLA